MNDMSVHVIAIDTNIIIRLLIRDDEDQFKLAHDLIARHSIDKPVCINAVTITETIWVLEKRLRLPRITVRPLILEFLQSAEVYIPDVTPWTTWRGTLMQAHPDWSDGIVAAVNLELGCTKTLTFDARAARDVVGMELLE